ncbi:hypothetical protein Y1Q_0002230 [Alligator mississippiensis]|uniref:Uncharacterized protein n=1 Tax=Alligator mississippiensis TaxID=8496 RepID=A0A151MGE4_ALLMI|nr:hypothetical protein Y1Q_0002230 [Alligator mississippiensis]
MCDSSHSELHEKMDFTEAYSDRCSTVGLAAREGNIKILRKLIRQGYSVDVPDNRGWMPIHEAAAHNSSECLKLLIHSAPSDDYVKSKTFEVMGFESTDESRNGPVLFDWVPEDRDSCCFKFCLD